MNQLVLFIATIVSLLTGMYYGMRIRNNPERFWTYLIVGLVFTTPLMFGGYTWYDEFYVFGILFPGIPKIRLRAKASSITFALFCMYMLLESVRGILFFSQFGIVDALTKIRWILFFAITLLVFSRSNTPRIWKVYDKGLPYKITKAGIIFNFIYLGYGLVSIFLTGSVAFTQASMASDIYREGTSPFLAVFGSTGYVVSVYIVLIPAALMTIKDNAGKRSYIAWLSLSLSLATQMLYNSRSGILLFLVFLGVFIVQHGFRARTAKGLLKFVPLIGLVLLFQLVFNEIRLDVIYQDLLNTLHLSDVSNYNPELQDIKRKVWNTSAILALSENAYNFLFGWGLRAGGYIVSPYVYDLFLQAGVNAVYSEGVGTPGFAAIATDSGIVGLLLLAAILFFCIKQIQKEGRNDLFMFFAPIAFVLQLFVMNIFDVLLFYFSIMPYGANVVLSKCSSLHSVGFARTGPAVASKKMREIANVELIP